MLYEHHFRAMNTGIGVWVWSTDLEGVSIIRAGMRRAEDLFTGVEAELSRFGSTSALSQLNRAAGRGPQAISRMLWTVLVAALDAAYESGGIYDPTVLQSLERAGYDRSFDAIEASGDTVETDAPPVTTFGSWRRIGMDDAARSVELPSDLTLDLGGIAKGWTVDHVALALAPLGPVLVDAGRVGERRVSDDRICRDVPHVLQGPHDSACSFRARRSRWSPDSTRQIVKSGIRVGSYTGIRG